MNVEFLALTEGKILLLENGFFSWLKRTTNGSSFLALEKTVFKQKIWNDGEIGF